MKVLCEFSPGGKQYSYECDIEDVKIGDTVYVPNKDGEKKVKIAGFTEKEFPFELKKVLRIKEDEKEEGNNDVSEQFFSE